MSTVSATLTQNRTVLPSGKFRLISSIDSVVGFPDTSLFLMAYDGAVYQHVARVGDVENYPVGAESGIPYYRISAVQLEFDTVEEAEAESDAQKQGVQDLVTDYQKYTDEYEGTETNTYTAP